MLVVNSLIPLAEKQLTKERDIRTRPPRTDSTLLNIMVRRPDPAIRSINKMNTPMKVMIISYSNLSTFSCQLLHVNFLVD